jgi:hypothetical protein
MHAPAPGTSWLLQFNRAGTLQAFRAFDITKTTGRENFLAPAISLRAACRSATRERKKIMSVKRVGSALAVILAGAFVSSAQAAPLSGAEGTKRAMADFGVVEKTQVYIYGGRRYCFYIDAWNGPGWYRCGYHWREGYGWGGYDGWRGWHYRGRGHRGRHSGSHRDRDRGSVGRSGRDRGSIGRGGRDGGSVGRGGRSDGGPGMSGRGGRSDGGRGASSGRSSGGGSGMSGGGRSGGGGSGGGGGGGGGRDGGRGR